MTLNRLFLGDNSVVEVTTKETIDAIKLKLASRYSRCRIDPKIRFPGEQEDYARVVKIDLYQRPAGSIRSDTTGNRMDDRVCEDDWISVSGEWSDYAEASSDR